MKNLLTKFFQYAWQVIFLISLYSILSPAMWIGIPVILAVLFALIELTNPQKYMTVKQNRIVLGIFMPIAVIAIIFLGNQNLNAGLYNNGHIASLIVVSIQLVVGIASAFSPHNRIVKLFQDPNMEIK